MRWIASAVIMMLLGGCMVGRSQAGSVQLQLKCADNIPAGVPVEMELTVTNIGKKPISYWCGGPAKYPGAQHFGVSVTDALGTKTEVKPTNGQYVMGSGIGPTIKPGESMQVPLAIAPLDPGAWTIRATCTTWAATETAGTTVTIKEDKPAREQWERKLLASVRRGDDPFAQHVASHYRVEGVIKELLKDLPSDDDTVAMAAERTLFMVSNSPAGLDKAVRTAVAAQLVRPEGKANLNFLACLMDDAGHQPTDIMLDAVFAVAHCDVHSPGDELRYHAVGALRNFPQKKAKAELKGFLEDANERVRSTAKNALEHPWPPVPTSKEK